MSFGNKKCDPSKVYSMLDRPPVLECGGSLDKEGNDSFWGKSLTLQADEKEANIHFILDRYQKTGALSAAIRENPSYGDFSDIPSYHEAMNTISKAHEQFMMLDAKTRHKFKNDPTEFLSFVHDEKNKEQLYEMGLAVRPESAPVETGATTPQTPPAQQA